MCGACGEQGKLDWARPFLAGLPARSAVAAALKALARPGLRVTARGGGWLVAAPTGRTSACSSLTELIATARPWLDAPGEFEPRGSGTVTTPEPDARRPVRIWVDPDAEPQSLARGGDVVVPDREHEALALRQLATPPWSLRCYLAPTGPPDLRAAPEDAADLLVWLELARPEAIVAACAGLDIEVRDGHVVRACASW
ncbi:hypothetical protein [Amycolatopsis alkalitolerans]|uniref:Uncharacterized protein n=1 Tax=Amycolatopsis alkalitolerans TaxID=2547244 RepID=A0A5C4M099_9PSEU|nr:hypothetical protein [Amycolatopsis alkalitolerans]TNC24100.1 hypothetical protein FG385_18685 [Amycolatopsis alkalitolerans]